MDPHLGWNAVRLLSQISRRPQRIADPSFRDWLTQPSSSVFLVLLLALVLGGGAKWVQLARARRAVDRISGDDPEVEAIAEAAEHGRAGVADLFRLLAHPTKPEIRIAAGRALSRLWKADQLIPEEEQAIVSRGHVVTWKARRRYPRDLSRPIPMAVDFAIPFLDEDTDGDGVRADQLLWSYRIAGTDRATLETYSSWSSAPAGAVFAIDPRDYSSNGPHRLVLHLRVRTDKLTSIWERDLPQTPFTFEFDAGLKLDSLLTMPDEPRASALAKAIGLAPPRSGSGGPNFAPLNSVVALRDPPHLQIRFPIPCDLAHGIRLEIEGLSENVESGDLVVCGQSGPPNLLEIPLRIPANLPDDAFDQPTEARMRAVLTVDPQLGWSDPDVRSVWPGSLVTDWYPVRLVRL